MLCFFFYNKYRSGTESYCKFIDIRKEVKLLSANLIAGIPKHTHDPCFIFVLHFRHELQPRPISQVKQSAIRPLHIQTQQSVQEDACAALFENLCDGCVYGDEMWARERDRLTLWSCSACVVVEYDGHTAPGLTWDALGWPGLVYLQPIFVGPLCDVLIAR